jgi:tetratricopeptide (TPR) repeat protein
MSLLSSFTKNSRLQAAIKTVAQARKSEGGKADQLFLKAYAEFAEVIGGDLVLAQSLYNWGFALLQQAKTKSGEAAIKRYEEAVNKFSFCATVDPNFLGAAIDGGVALMELARIKAVAIDDSLYVSAKEHFERAESIHKGTAVYNLACIYALMENDDACQAALLDAVKHGNLPSEQEVLQDPDLDKVKTKSWFLDFIESLHTVAETTTPAAQQAAEESVEAGAVDAKSPENPATDSPSEDKVTSE